MTLDDLKPGLRHSATIRVSEQLAVPAGARLFGSTIEMPPVFATAQMIAFVEWTCVAALAPYLAPQHRTVGIRVDMTHLEGFHERAIIDYDRFMARLARKKPST